MYVKVSAYIPEKVRQWFREFAIAEFGSAESETIEFGTAGEGVRTIAANKRMSSKSVMSVACTNLVAVLNRSRLSLLVWIGHKTLPRSFEPEPTSSIRIESLEE